MAEAKIAGRSVVVWNDDVPKPVAVRYGWAVNPGGNLFNKGGLPTWPFRTDTWPVLTEKRARTMAGLDNAHVR